MNTKASVRATIGKYAEAWKNRDPEAIIRIFAKNGRYHERVLDKPFIGHKAIKQYWTDKVVGEQTRIRFKLHNLYLDGNTAIAEWEARFYDKKKRYSTHMKEIAVLELAPDGKIRSLREYWTSEHY